MHRGGPLGPKSNIPVLQMEKLSQERLNQHGQSLTVLNTSEPRSNPVLNHSSPVLERVEEGWRSCGVEGFWCHLLVVEECLPKVQGFKEQRSEWLVGCEVPRLSF